MDVTLSIGLLLPHDVVIDSIPRASTTHAANSVKAGRLIIPNIPRCKDFLLHLSLKCSINRNIISVTYRQRGKRELCNIDGLLGNEVFRKGATGLGIF